MSAVTHVTETGLALCAGAALKEATLEETGMRPWTVACDGSDADGRHTADVIVAVLVRDKVPTCPRCAVLRDEALEGRLPRRTT